MEDSTVELSFDDFKDIKPGEVHKKAPIAEYTLNGKLIKVHKNLHQACVSTQASPSMITNCCRGLTLTSRKIQRIFLYGGDSIKQRLDKIKDEGCFRDPTRIVTNPIREYTVDGVFLKTWCNVKAAADAFSISHHALTKHLKNPDKPLKGRFFLFKDDKIEKRVEAWVKKEQKRLEKGSLVNCAEEVCSIDVYTSDGEFLKTCKSAKEASSIYEISSTSICNQLYGHALVTRGLMFLHHGEDIQERLNKVKNRKTWKKNL